MTEFTASFDGEEYGVTIVSGEGTFTVYLVPEELDKFINCLLLIKEDA